MANPEETPKQASETAQSGGIKLDLGIGDYLKNANVDNEHGVFNDFIKRFRNSNFNPDVNGYTLIYMIPPNLGGPCETLGYTKGSGGNLGDISRQFPFLAVDFTPPETTVKSVEETSGASVTIPYSTGASSGGQLSINFIEDSDLSVTNYHNMWVEYIKEVVYGDRSPHKDYIDGEHSGELDYATSAYVLKFKPDMKTLVYVGKATGIFPLNIPSKEVIGNRQSNELSMVGCNYTCSMYSAYIVGGINSWVLDNVQIDLCDHFGLKLPKDSLATAKKVFGLQEIINKNFGKK
jgi:hypothetical protein